MQNVKFTFLNCELANALVDWKLDNKVSISHKWM